MPGQCILYVHQGRIPEEVRAEKICTALSSAGYTVYALARWFGEKSRIEQHPGGFTIVRAGFGKMHQASVGIPGNPLWKSEIHSLSREIKPNLIISREMMQAGACASVAAKLDIPMIIDMAEHYPAAMREWKKYRVNPLLRLLVHTWRVPDYVEKKAVARAQGIITVCAEQNTRLEQTYGYLQENMAIVHNTPPLELFHDVKKFSASPPRIFGHHGYFTLERNLEMLVKGFDLAAHDHSSIELVLAGIGETFSDTVETAKKLSSRGRIHFTGEYKAADLPDLYSSIDIGILPYTIDEFRNHTLPNKVFDYLACGKPVISSQLRPMQRLINESQAGITGSCNTPREISALITRMIGADTTTMGRLGLQAANNTYNWQQDASILLAFIKNKIC
jgi:glycosyltransferase involved in cell wall biosynthesis